jgi:hypothetical protein
MVMPSIDPRTEDPPWSIVAMSACTFTSSLPSAAPRCTPPTSGHVVVEVDLVYRPIVAVTFTGVSGASAGGYAQGYSVPPYVGSNDGIGCYANGSPTKDCARHLDPGGGWLLRTTSFNDGGATPLNRELVSWDGPCSGQGLGVGENQCTFTVPTGDVCVTLDFTEPDTSEQATTLTGNTCPTGPGDQ